MTDLDIAKALLNNWAKSRIQSDPGRTMTYDQFAACIADAMNTVRQNTFEAAYLAARGTDKLKSHGNSQMYWKGRADAANDVRALKGKP